MGKNTNSNKNCNIGQNGFSRSDEIRFNAEEIKSAEEKLKKQKATYVVKVPSARGSGAAVKEIHELAEKMKAVYDQTELLIAASAKMLESIGVIIETTDEKLAVGYSANGTCYTVDAGGRSKP